MINDHAEALGTFVTEDARGKHLPRFLSQLAQKLESERETLTRELDDLRHHIEHINDIVSMKQSYVKAGDIQEEIKISDILDDILKSVNISFLRHNIELSLSLHRVPLLYTNKYKVMHILFNLISNAKHALVESDGAERRLTLYVFHTSNTHIAIEVTDNGVGIKQDHLTRIFQHGFTTKQNGHGFGLHSSTLAAQELGGALTVHSEGLGCGATFRLELPIHLKPLDVRRCSPDSNRGEDGLALVESRK